MNPFGLRFRRGSAVAVASILLAAVAHGSPVNAAGESDVARPVVHGVVVGQTQQLSDALGLLSISRPELSPQILETLDSGAIAGGASMAQAVRSGTALSAASLGSAQSSGKLATTNAVALSSTPTFQGAITLTGFDRTNNGSVVGGQLTHNAIFDRSSGTTPYFSCVASTQQCKFTV